MALYATLPDYQGLYFQGVAENIRKDFAFEAMKTISICDSCTSIK